MSSSSNLTTPPITPADPRHASSSDLRFPVAAADGSLEDLRTERLTTTMLSRQEEQDDDHSLTGSTYEFVDTDVESRDGHTTASLASTDVGRPDDDVASLAETEHSDESEEEEHRNVGSSIPALLSLENTSSFDTPTIGRSAGTLYDEYDRPFSQSIEFHEPSILDSKTISVKHTVEEFNAEQTNSTAKSLNVKPPAGRFSLTIRQTMSKYGLSTRDPLRILYVGSHSAKEDILRKIGSSLNSSADNLKARSTPSQLYNIVQVSAYRPEEIELMHSSGIQFMVEDCVSVDSMPFEDKPDKPDVIKLRVDNLNAYHSVPEESGFIVEPAWELPHIAVFYCSSGDNAETKRTRSLVRKFMNRHNVPSIVISHQIVFDRSFCMTLDQHSVHMCLESKDPVKRKDIIHQRLPIDLTSFLNIDARQMNRNLAYITGLHDAPAQVTPTNSIKISNFPAPKDIETSQGKREDQASEIRAWMFYARIGMVVVGILSLLFAKIPVSLPSSSSAISVNSKTMEAVSISSTTTSLLSSSISTTSSIETLQVVKTSASVAAFTPSTRVDSLSVVPSREVGTVPKLSSHQPKVNKNVCTAETLGDREILIRIPAPTKLSWLAREAISVNLTRNNITVDTERVYSSDEGLVLLVAKKEAYGALRLSIITTKKPRINETFQVDFGSPKSQTLHEAFSKVCSIVTDDVALLDQTVKRVRKVVHQAVDNALIKVPTFDHVKQKATLQASSAGQAISDTAKRVSTEVMNRRTALSKDISAKAAEKVALGYKRIERLQEPLSKNLLKAQVQARLVWLQIQGRDAEYSAYKERAAKAAIIRQDSAKWFSKCGGRKIKGHGKANHKGHKCGKKSWR
jgi:hypothetical protein